MRNTEIQSQNLKTIQQNIRNAIRNFERKWPTSNIDNEETKKSKDKDSKNGLKSVKVGNILNQTLSTLTETNNEVDADGDENVSRKYYIINGK